MKWNKILAVLSLVAKPCDITKRHVKRDRHAHEVVALGHDVIKGLDLVVSATWALCSAGPLDGGSGWSAGRIRLSFPALGQTPLPRNPEPQL